MNEKKILCKHKEELLLKCKELVENPPKTADLTKSVFFQLGTINTLLVDCEKCNQEVNEQ